MRNNLDRSMEHTKANLQTRKPEKPSTQANMTTGAKQSQNIEKKQNFVMHKLLTEAIPSRGIKTACKSSLNLVGY
jgi:hypothetical protein